MSAEEREREPAQPASSSKGGWREDRVREDRDFKSVEHDVESVAVLNGHKGDVYAVRFNPAQPSYLASAGYDKTVRPKPQT